MGLSMKRYGEPPGTMTFIKSTFGFVISVLSCDVKKRQTQRQQLFLQQQQQQKLPLGGAIIAAFPIKLLKHIANYLDKPSRALFAVSLGNFDISYISSKISASIKESTASLFKRRKISDDIPLRLADIPTEALQHAASFIASPSQTLFGLSIAAVNDEKLNRSSFAVVGDEWDILDFGEIEKDLAMRLSDDDIKAVLLCIDAANRVKKLSLANCINITGSCLEPLRGSETIEQIDLSLVGDHEEPTLTEIWHPPIKMEYWCSREDVVVPFDPPISCELVLPILDSIIEREGNVLKHLQFPKSWRRPYDPLPALGSFLKRYNQMLMNRNSMCLRCNRNLPSRGYTWTRSSSNRYEDFGIQNHTCSQCMKHYCYRCNDEDAVEQYNERTSPWGEGNTNFMLERCKKCERDYCTDCSAIHQCSLCTSYHCADSCKTFTNCSTAECGKMICEGCVERQTCERCKKVYCVDETSYCHSCDSNICYDCDLIDDECSNESCEDTMCRDCASDAERTCQKCKQAFCGASECCATCQYCKQTFCRDCVTFRRCEDMAFHDTRKGIQCAECDEKGVVDIDFVHRCESCNIDLCGKCRLKPCHVSNAINCDGCARLLTDADLIKGEGDEIDDDTS
eukprot:scaffold1170_cov125-Skeletonema_marinoi.AAC.15